MFAGCAIIFKMKSCFSPVAELTTAVTAALDKAGLAVSADEISFQHPADLNHGDYCTNIALVLAGRKQQKPIDLAAAIVQTLNAERMKPVARITIAGPGFINFWLSKKYLVSRAGEILRKEKFKKELAVIGKGKTVTRALQNVGETVEGAQAIDALYRIALREKLNLPVLRSLYEIVCKKKKAKKVFNDLVMNL